MGPYCDLKVEDIHKKKGPKKQEKAGTADAANEFYFIVKEVRGTIE